MSTDEARGTCAQCGAPICFEAFLDAWLHTDDDLDQDHDAQGPDSSDLAAAFADAGFVIERTGGGCECYRRDRTLRGVLGAEIAAVEIVNLESDALLPSHWGASITVGLYTRSNWERETGNHVLNERVTTARKLLKANDDKQE